MPTSIWKIFCSEWKFWLSGAVLLFIFANIQISGLQAGAVPDLSFPYMYEKDMLFHSWMIQRVMEGWLYENPRSGFPFGSNFLDYPGSDVANHFLLKILGYIGGSYHAAINLFYLMSFVTTFVAGYVVLRALGLSVALAFGGAVVFDILPFHFLRLEHLFYTSLFLVPVFFYLAFVCFAYEGKLPGQRGGRARTVFWVLGLLAAASFGVYNVFFGVMVILTAGVAGSLARSSLRPLILSGICSGILSIGVLLNVAPNIAHTLTTESNTEIPIRLPQSSEYYGLKFVQMVLPQPEHRNQTLAAIAKDYADSFPLVNENESAALGMIGTVGLLSLMFVIVMQLSGRAVDPKVSLIALIVLTLFVFGTIGGLSSLFAMVVSPALRGWNRVSVFIGFGAVAASFLFLQMLMQRYAPAHRARITQACLAVALVAFAMWDQVPPADLESRIEAKREFDADTALVRAIETDLPEGAAIYQLPYIGFPESPLVHQVGPYTPLTGFINSETLRWSSGGMKARSGDLFYRALAQEPLTRQLDIVKELGFSGIYIDKRGYEDGGLGIVADLSALLGRGPNLAREDDKIVFFRLENAAPVTFEGLTAYEIMKSVGYVADLNGVRYKSSLDQGIDFSLTGFPDFVRRAQGLSVQEPWGRWSDANVAPTIRFDFSSGLPEQFVLILDLITFGPNASQPMSVVVGNSTYQVVLPAGEGTVRLPVQNPEGADFIEMRPPHPVSPADLRLSTDKRRLAIGLRKLIVEPDM
eukprot:s1_g1459.t1